MDVRTASQGVSCDYRAVPDGEAPRPWSGDYGFGSGDRRLAFSRQASFRQPDPWSRKDSLRPHLARSASSITIPPETCSQLEGENGGTAYGRYPFGGERPRLQKFSFRLLVLTVFRAIRSGNRPMKRLSLMIFLNVAYSTAELVIGIFSGRVGEWNAHYLIVSAVTNLLVNLLGVWFFRSYARVNLACRKAEGLILASWFLTLGVENAEVLCLGLASVAVFMVVMPLFKATGSILFQMSPTTIPPSVLHKCWRQITALEDVSEVSQARFWELVPGHAVGSISIQLKEGADDYRVRQYAHSLYHDLGIQDLTIEMVHS